MHAVYLTARQKILNRVTFDEMRQRDIDITTPCPVVDVRGKTGIGSNINILRGVLRRLWDPQSTATGVREPALLGIDQCKALLRLEEIIRWNANNSAVWFVPDEGGFSEPGDWDFWPRDDLDISHHLIFVDEMDEWQREKILDLRRSNMGSDFFVDEWKFGDELGQWGSEGEREAFVDEWNCGYELGWRESKGEWGFFGEIQEW